MRSVIISFLLLGLLSCGGNDHRDLSEFIAKTKQRPAGRIEPIPTFPPYESYIYSSASLRSPFDRPIDIQRRVYAQANSDVRPDFNRVKEPLESFDLASLSMVGTLKMGGGLWALVEDPSGGILKVASGNYIGQNHGKVVAVDNSKIELIEIVSDGLDGWVERPRLLALSKKD
jgi:type IV pilus assembly protein PilP